MPLAERIIFVQLITDVIFASRFEYAAFVVATVSLLQVPERSEKS